ncbi:hypothetical protein DL546_007881 [Coniochaeta pulveracea]|nr:hypothetical protein DL546_007881 [Coniochaeta pulveracea]
MINNMVPRPITSMTAEGTCFNHTSAFVLASAQHPYRVFTGAWPGPNGCGMSIDVDESGSLDHVTDSWSYAANSGLHGLALGNSTPERLYSADLNGDAIWTHKISPENGKAALVGKLTVKAGSHPRHLALHPAGKLLYAVMEAGNRIAAYSIDETTGALSKELSTFSLIPPGSNSSGYWSAEVLLSHDARYIWATARAQSNTNRTGYISAFLLDDAGLIVKRMFRVPTTTTGGVANAISPAPWGSEWAAMTDVPKGYVQIWRMTGGKEGVYAGAQAVARVDIADGGCCANAIWYD